MGEVVPFALALKPGVRAEPPTTSVYVIEVIGGGWTKVGISENPRRRLADLQNSTPYRLRLVHYSGPVPRSIALEIEFLTHVELSLSYRRRGEWFECSPREALIGLADAAQANLNVLYRSGTEPVGEVI
jgi:hypothetical protein